MAAGQSVGRGQGARARAGKQSRSAGGRTPALVERSMLAVRCGLEVAVAAFTRRNSQRHASRLLPQREVERRPVAVSGCRHALRPYTSAVTLNNLLYRREAHAGAGKLIRAV